MKRQTFIVTGSGFFPLDMLRYDSCFPNSQQDVGKMDNSHTQEVMHRRDITLARYVRNKSSLPTIDRWKSFGWTVNITSIQTI